MSEQSKYVTVMLVPDGTEARVAWRMRRWLLYLLVGGVTTILVGILVFFVFYGKIVARAATTEKVMAENEALLRYRYKVQLLEKNLDEARDFVSRLATLAGVDVTLPELPDDSTLFAQLDDHAQAVVAHSYNADWSTPSGLPARGFITQDFEPEENEHYHPGIDIACAVGTPVLATGAGIVLYTGYDSTYGNILVIKHDDSTTTVYGHNDTVLVEQGQHVMAGSRVALSGNTGKSTAPHVHYEVRINDQPINPLDNPYAKETEHE